MIDSKRINALVAIVLSIAIVFGSVIAVSAKYLSENGGSRQDPQYVSKIFGTDIITIDIIADETEWQRMLDNAQNEEYIMADIVINGTKFQKVGIRPKGNSSLTQVSQSDSDRYSFRIKFDKYIKGQTCFGLDHIVINNMMGDYTYMKEFISYDIMKEAGVDAPYTGFADVKLNGETWGLYLAVELYGEGYEQRVFGDTSGFLYNVKSMDMGGGNVIERNFNGENIPANNQNRNNFQDNVGNLPQSSEDGQQNNMPRSTENIPANNSGSVDGQPLIAAVSFLSMSEPRASAVIPLNNSYFAPQGQQRPAPSGMPDMGEHPVPQAAQDITESTQPSASPDAANTPQANRFRVDGNGGGMGGRGGGGSLEYTDDNSSSYSSIFGNAVENNSKESDYQRVIAAHKALSEGTNLEEYFDVEQILRYLAAHTVVVNLDSYSSSMAQNYYLYENNGKVTILPWDYNLSWGGFQSGNGSSIINFPIDTPVSGVEMSSRPLIDKLFENTEYLEMYHSFLQQIVDNYFLNGKFEEKVRQIDSLIHEYVKNDPTAFCTYEQYQAAVETFISLGNLRAESIQGQLDGTVPSTTAAQNDNSDKLVKSDGVNISTLGSMGGARVMIGNINENGQGGPGWMDAFVIDGGDFDFQTIMQAMEIIQDAGGEITEAVKDKLIESGFTEEQITAFSEMNADAFQLNIRGQGQDGNFPGLQMRDDQNINQFNNMDRQNGAEPNNFMRGNIPGNADIAPPQGVSQTQSQSAETEYMVMTGTMIIVLLGAVFGVSRVKRNY